MGDKNSEVVEELTEVQQELSTETNLEIQKVETAPESVEDQDNSKDSLHSVYNSDTSTGNSSGDEAEKTDSRESEKNVEDQDSDSCYSDAVIIEREEGDGEESLPSNKVDDDEDKKNPQYIPKRGTFYEHDDRTLDDSAEEQETAEKIEKPNKKNVWMEKKERWSHDRFNENEQTPKSRAELVAIYGYDIRNEDGPPRARRRRRYGRGPNKYTRTWEDEDAYKPLKPVKINPKKPRNPTKEEYPALTSPSEESHEGASGDHNEEENEKLEETLQSKSYSSSTENNYTTTNDRSNQETRRTPDHYNNRTNPRVGTGRIMKPKTEVKKEIKDPDYKGFTKTRQFRNSKSEQKILFKNQRKDRQDFPQNNRNSLEDLERDLNKMNIQDGISKGSNKNNQRQASVPPRLQTEQKGSKRYSSLRQRSLPETAAPPFNQSSNYYGNDYNQQSQASPPQQNILPQPNQIIASAGQVPHIAPPPMPTLPQQVPVTATQILQAPPPFAAAYPQPPPAFLQPAVPPATFLPQPAPPIINYVPGQPQFPPAPPPYQGYQHQQFNTVNQPAEVYQCQGGTTYYSTQNQHLGQRVAPRKRPKVAIPIIPPPPQEPRGRGRIGNQRENSPIGEEVCEALMHANAGNYEDPSIIVQQ